MVIYLHANVQTDAVLSTSFPKLFDEGILAKSPRSASPASQPRNHLMDYPFHDLKRGEK
jgi:hypothetical protein